MVLSKRWAFESGRQGFRYEDDVFRFTSEPDHASGGRERGALTVQLGGADRGPVDGMSGGWNRDFAVDEAQRVTLTFRVKIEQDEDFGPRKAASVRVMLDGETVELDGKPTVARLYGDGAGGGERTFGWTTIEVDLGRLAAGRHEITLGAGLNRASPGDGVVEFRFDDVELVGRVPKPKLGAFEAEVLRLTNAFRDKHGLDPVRAEKNLTAAAEDWSRAMAKGDFFRHSDTADLIEEHGYDAAGWGENIAAGYPSAKAVVNGWISSPGHRANMLREDFEHLGIGHYYKKGDGGAAPYGHYWTQIFGVASEDYLV